jgi:hypothetical protein
VLGWLNGGPNALYALTAACVPGMLGHGIANLVIGRLGGLTVSVFQLLQPISGTTIGYLAGVQGPPGIASLLCAPVILYGAFMVTVGSREKDFSWNQVLRCQIRLGPPRPAPTTVVQRSKEPSVSGSAMDDVDTPTWSVSSEETNSAAASSAATMVGGVHASSSAPTYHSGRVEEWGPIPAHVQRMVPQVREGSPV